MPAMVKKSHGEAVEAEPPAEPPRLRSINDLETVDELRYALSTMNCPLKGSPVENSKPCAEDMDWIMGNVDEATSTPQTLEAELERLQVLSSYLVMESEPEPKFDRITALACRILKAPICVVSFLDIGRQWFLSAKGLGDLKEAPRCVSFCGHAILSKKDLFIINDTFQDERFAKSPLVLGSPFTRFYAGAPLICPEGYKLGTFCVLDIEPRPGGLSLKDKQNMFDLRDTIMEALVQRRKEKTFGVKKAAHLLASTAHDILTPLNGIQMSLSLLKEDQGLHSKMTFGQKDLLQKASECSHVIHNICEGTISSMKDGQTRTDGKHTSFPCTLQQRLGAGSVETADPFSKHEIVSICMDGFVKRLRRVVEPISKDITILISQDSDVPEYILSDCVKLFRSTLNLLTNACDRTEKGLVHLKISVRDQHKQKKARKCLVFKCEDKGAPVHPYDLPQLFQLLKKGSSNETSEFSGTCAAKKTTRLDLSSLAMTVKSLGGEYGYGFNKRFLDDEMMQCTLEDCTETVQPLEKGSEGAVFWFSIPLFVPLPENEGATASTAVSCDSKCSIDEDLPAEKRKRQHDQDDSDGEVCIKLPRNRSQIADEPVCLGGGPSTAIDMEVVVQDELRPTSHQKRERIALVIEDSVVIRKVLKRALNRQGFVVKDAENGMIGLKELQNSMFDLVLCDFLMPVMDGLACIQQYRDWEKIHRPWFRQYVVGMSAHAGSSDAERGLRSGMDKFLAKPVTIKHIKELEDSLAVKSLSLVLDKLHTSCSSTLRQLSFNESDHLSERGSTQVCLVGVMKSPNTGLMMDTIRDLGYDVSLVHSGEDVLRLLKMRYWDAVFLDDELPGLTAPRCLDRFRKWEKENRVSGQKNVFLVSPSYVPVLAERAEVVAPKGFDGAIGKPVLPKDIKEVLSQTSHLSDILISGD